MFRPPSMHSVSCVSVFCFVALAAGAASAEPDQNRARSSFEQFADSWVGELKAEAEKARARATLTRPAASSAASAGYRSYSPDFQVRLKPTGDPSVPFVGILTYTENVYTCDGSGQCQLASSSPITEIFPFENGRWKY